ncbi:putative disease resistance RPP13-like protein 1 [Vitis vinifera]|uniref:Putative disease resistance RPP13-like protein 1 n=1 Tax=Vitis vinifera TaxID=29760 RepID=A0A438CQY5_VITVI|nr:putative disease resistance RPP13-like protein 1 [Vitis vinifera]
MRYIPKKPNRVGSRWAQKIAAAQTGVHPQQWSWDFTDQREEEAMTVGEAFLSAFLQVLFDRLASREFVELLRGRKLDEEKQFSSPAVEKWLHMAKDALYDAEDVLDELATDALQSKLEGESQNGKNPKSNTDYQQLRWWKKSCVYGRDDDEKLIIEGLLRDELSNAKVGFDVMRITKTLVESITSKTPEVNDLNLLQVSLRDKVVGHRFLLVLDDVWSKRNKGWDLLLNPLRAGAPGSKIIVTTRNADVASSIGTVPAHHLKGLSFEDCWSLFKSQAFEDRNIDAHPQFGSDW